EFGLRDDRYTFVPATRFCDPHPYRHCLPRTEVTKIYNQTTVNNYYIYNNNTVINKGITPQNVPVVREHMREVAILETAGKPSSSKHDVIDKRSNTLVVYRPQLPVNLTSTSGNVSRDEIRKSPETPSSRPLTPVPLIPNSAGDKSSSVTAGKRDEITKPVS